MIVDDPQVRSADIIPAPLVSYAWATVVRPSCPTACGTAPVLGPSWAHARHRHRQPNWPTRGVVDYG